MRDRNAMGRLIEIMTKEARGREINREEERKRYHDVGSESLCLASCLKINAVYCPKTDIPINNLHHDKSFWL